MATSDLSVSANGSSKACLSDKSSLALIQNGTDESFKTESMSNENSNVEITKGSLSHAEEEGSLVLTHSSRISSRKSSKQQMSNPADIRRVLESSWIVSQKEIINEKLIAARKLKRQRMLDEKAAAEQLERTLPLELLALDWFNENTVSSDLRIYLIDRLLPTLVLGLEKVLIEAEKFGLLEQDLPIDDPGGIFSPINYLAQYLMRNNPRYSHLNQSSPYARGLRKVSEELKQDILAMEESKLALLKLEAKNKRELVEEHEVQKANEAKERARLLKIQFPHWLVDNGQLQLQLVQNALYSYLEISSHLASDIDNVIHYNRELDPTDESGETLTIQEYIDYLEEFVCKMTMPEFKQLLRHLDQCAAAYRRTFEREVWRDMFIKLFNTLDTESSGYIDRHRMLHLLEKFWDKLEDNEKNTLHNPRKWPVVELEEIDDLFLDSDEDSGSDEIVSISTEEFASIKQDSTKIQSLPDEVASTEELARPSLEQELPQSQQSLKPAEGLEKEEFAQETPLAASEDKLKEIVEKQSAISASDEKLEIASTKVSSAAGDDTFTPEIAKSEVFSLKNVDDSAADVKDSQPIKEASAEEVKKEDKHDESDLVADKETKTPEAQSEVQTTVEEKSNAVVEAVQDGDTDAKDAETEEPKPDEPQLEEQVEVKDADVQEEKEKSLDDEKREIFKTKEFFSSNAFNLSATLITPAQTTYESTDVEGPVNVQFSKEELNPKVRKTTSITTVQQKSSLQIDEQTPEKETAEESKEEYQASEEKLFEPTPRDEKPEEFEKDSETLVTSAVEVSETVLIQHTADDMFDYVPQPIEVKTRPASASRMSVTFAAETLILPDRPSVEFFSHYSSRSQSRITSVFDENQLDERRFISLLENFLQEEADHSIVEQLVNFIHGGYVETEEEKMSRLEKARREILSAKHKQMVDNLFNKWDNDGQGYISHEEVDDILLKYKGGVEASALKRGRQALRIARKNAPYHDRRRLNRKEFHVYINSICDAMVGGEEVFDGLVEFVTNTVERTYTERIRGEARRKWMSQILSSAETGGASMEHVYRSVFQTLRKDAEAHGNQKKISAYIALLEHNLLAPERGNFLLRYVACTPDNAPFMLGKAFYEDMKGISFYAVRRGKLVHVPRVQSHGRIYFWNPMREEEDCEGSLVLVPVRDERRRTFGLLGVDNVDSSANTDRSIFASHEINFYQGIVKSFSTAFHHIDLRKKLLRIVDSAMSWVHSRASRVRNVVVYFVEPDPKGQTGSVLRKMVTADNNTGLTITHTRPQRLYRKDNLFRDYLFKTMENSETTSADAYGERHTAYPLRDDEGRCQCVIDISIGKLKSLPGHEFREVQRMLKLLQAANREVMKESIGGEKTVVLEAEEKANDDVRVDIMFDRLMLTDLRDNVNKLDSNVFAELKYYKEPPPMIHNILQAVLLLYHQDTKILNELADWITCKQMVTNKLRQWIVTYDPTSEQESQTNDEEMDELVQTVGKLLKGIPHGAVAKQGSKPAQQLYNWAFVCLSLIEHARKVKQNEGQPAVTPVTSASTNTTHESLDVPVE